MVSDLDLHGGNVFEELNVVEFETVGVLKAFGRFKVIFFLFVDGSHGVPAEHAFHLTFHQGGFRCLESFILFTETQFEQGLHSDGFRVIRMSLQQFLGML
jgi:hypothetical protein